MAGEPALPRLRRKCRRRSGARATPRWSAERRTSRLRGTGTPRKREVASYRRDELRWYASRRSAGPLISGPELQLTPRIRARAPPKRRQMQRRCGGDKETRRDNPGAENAPRERDGLRVRPRGGLFDIVKKDDGRGPESGRAAGGVRNPACGAQPVTRSGGGGSGRFRLTQRVPKYSKNYLETSRLSRPVGVKYSEIVRRNR